jgi:hypothetical protein
VTPDGNIIIVAVMRAQKAEQGCRIIRAWKSAFPSGDRIPIGALCFRSRRRARRLIENRAPTGRSRRAKYLRALVIAASES